MLKHPQLGQLSTLRVLDSLLNLAHAHSHMPKPLDRTDVTKPSPDTCILHIYSAAD